MITLEMITSDDPLLIGEYPFLFDLVFLGRSPRADIILNDQEVPKKFLTFKIIKKDLVVQSEPHSPFYFVNGKKMSGMRRLKKGDILAFGGHQLKIIHFEKSTNETEDDLSEYFELVKKEVPDLLPVLNLIEDKIIENERKEEGINV